MPLRQDFIGRLIEQLVEALGRVNKKLEEQRVDEAEAELREAEQALGLPRGIELFDARSVALMSGGGDKVVLAALLAEKRAAIAKARGDAAREREQRARALALLDACTPFELKSVADALRARLTPAH